MDEDEQTRTSLGMLVGVAASVGVAGLLTGTRGVIDSANVALILMVVVVLAAAIGGRTVGIVSAAAAALSYDFFHTQPYWSLRIDSRDDVETALLLLLGGLVVGQLAARARVSRQAADDTRMGLRRLHRIGELAAHGAPATDVIAAAERELCALLSLSSCRYEPAPCGTELDLLSRSGAIAPRASVNHFGRYGFELPLEGVQLAVLDHGVERGRFTMIPTPGRGSSLEARIAAVALADQVGAALAPPAAQSV